MINPTPFCILDEVDAALDEANVERFLRVLEGFVADTQFLVVTHHKRTMADCQVLYGITMQRKGISSRMAVSLAEVKSGRVDKIMEAEYEKEMDGVITEGNDNLLSLDEMEKMLEDEVAAEIGPIEGSKTREVAVETESDSDVSDKISEGRKRLKGLMEEDK